MDFHLVCISSSKEFFSHKGSVWPCGDLLYYKIFLTMKDFFRICKVGLDWEP